MLSFDAGSHQYTWDGIVVPSVTQIIGEWRRISVYGVEYYCNRFTGHVIDVETFTAAGHRGTAIHTGAKMIAEGKQLDLSVLHPSLLNPILEFQRWMEMTCPVIDIIEVPMYSERHGFAGTPDIIASIGRKLCVIDIKTGSSYAMAGVQTAAYAQLYRERIKRGTLNVGRYVLHLPSSGPYKFIRLPLDTDWDLFRSMLFEYYEIKRRFCSGYENHKTWSGYCGRVQTDVV
jgi:hypothetical protein